MAIRPFEYQQWHVTQLMKMGFTPDAAQSLSSLFNDLFNADIDVTDANNRSINNENRLNAVEPIVSNNTNNIQINSNNIPVSYTHLTLPTIYSV